MKDQIHKINEEYSIRVIDNLREFNEIKDVWNNLSAMNESYWPWLCWEWFSLWLKYFSSAIQLLILLVYREGSVVAIAPFMLRLEKYKGLIKIKKLELIGNVHSTIRNVLFGVSDDREKILILESIFRFIDKERKNWDVVEMERIPEQENNFSNLKTAVEKTGLRYRVYSTDANWYLDNIDYTSAAYFHNQPHRLKKQITYQMKRLEKKNALHIHIKSNIVSLENDLDMYEKLREKSWKAPESGKEFTREFCILAHDKGWLRLGFLFSNDIPIAGHKWIVHKKAAYILSLLYDEDYQKYSPGSILSSKMFGYVIDQDKVAQIDYLTGDEPYKKIWTPERRERKGMTVFNNNVKGRLLSLLILTFLPIFKKTRFLSTVKNNFLAYFQKYNRK